MEAKDIYRIAEEVILELIESEGEAILGEKERLAAFEGIEKMENQLKKDE